MNWTQEITGRNPHTEYQSARLKDMEQEVAALEETAALLKRMLGILQNRDGELLVVSRGQE